MLVPWRSRCLALLTAWPSARARRALGALSAGGHAARRRAAGAGGRRRGGPRRARAAARPDARPRTTSGAPGRASSPSRSTTCGTPPTCSAARPAALSTALRKPQVRGRWGELHLRRAVELAGLVDACDFDEQVHAPRRRRRAAADLVVHLAGGKHVVVDAKVPLDAFLDATEHRRRRRARRPPGAARPPAPQHVDPLAGKAYWRALPDDAGVRRAVRAGRVVPVGRAGGRPGAARVRRRRAGRARDADDADRAAAHRRPRLDARRRSPTSAARGPRSSAASCTTGSATMGGHLDSSAARWARPSRATTGDRLAGEPGAGVRPQAAATSTSPTQELATPRPVEDAPRPTARSSSSRTAAAGVVRRAARRDVLGGLRGARLTGVGAVAACPAGRRPARPSVDSSALRRSSARETPASGTSRARGQTPATGRSEPGAPRGRGSTVLTSCSGARQPARRPTGSGLVLRLASSCLRRRCAGGAARRDFFTVGVLPPLLLGRPCSPSRWSTGLRSSKADDLVRPGGRVRAGAPRAVRW